MVHLSTSILPQDKPRYVMGVGYLIDQLMAIALGADMFDCVYPTRTAVFLNNKKVAYFSSRDLAQQ